MTTLVLTPSVAAISDELGNITAEIKRLTAQKDKLATQFKEMGLGSYSGSVWLTTVFNTPATTGIDYKSVLIARGITLTDDEITAHTVTTRVGYLSAKTTKV
jgi:hypothetical protein